MGKCILLLENKETSRHLFSIPQTKHSEEYPPFFDALIMKINFDGVATPCGFAKDYATLLNV